MKNSENENPIEKYPQPPFEEQSQEVPGVGEEMNPRPDHGEESYQGHGLLKDQAVIITGGDSGIGKATAIAMAREGADILISYKDDVEDVDAIEATKWIRAAGRRCVIHKGDIQDEKVCQEIVHTCMKEFGKIDVLINNAAYQMTYDTVEEVTAEEWNKTFDTNIRAMFFLIKYAKPQMKPGSSIINTTSINAYKPNPSLFPYAATKGAIHNLTASLAQKFMEDGSGIRVNAVAPGPVWTPLIPSTIPDHPEFGKENSPMGRPAQPAEIAPIYVFLASSGASYVSGATIAATGGAIAL